MESVSIIPKICHVDFLKWHGVLDTTLCYKVCWLLRHVDVFFLFHSPIFIDITE